MKANQKLKYVICFLLLVGAACFSACNPSQAKLEKIGEEAKAKYDAEYLPAFNAYIQQRTGFSDLTVETRLVKYGEYFYHEYDNSATYYLHYINLHSDDIDRYYTNQRDNTGYELKRRMSYLLSDLRKGESFSYTLDDGMTVNVYADLVSDTSCYIYTSEDREYYYYYHDGYEWVEIDDEFVYFKSGKSGSSSSKSGTKSYNSTGSSGSKRYYSNNDPYDVDQYNDPDDFAYDYEEEFDGYEDAYDYWEEEHD